MTPSTLAAQRKAMEAVHAIANLCPNCGRNYTPEVVEQAVTDASGHTRIETVILKYCPVCREEMKASLRRAA